MDKDIEGDENEYQGRRRGRDRLRRRGAGPVAHRASAGGAGGHQLGQLYRAGAQRHLSREQIRGKKIIANPGCYTTAVPLALAPALRKGYIAAEGIIADCKSGVTGAGRKLTQNTHYPELNEGFSAYKVAAHRHTPDRCR